MNLFMLLLTNIYPKMVKCNFFILFLDSTYPLFRFLAAKVYYFGLSASLASFEEFVKTKGIFACKDLWISSDSSVPRKIIQLKRINQK